MIPRDFIDTLLARVDIVDVIDRRVPLKKAGQNYQACCPFHTEKTPSFTVSPTKQFYHCFGCGAHGTAIGFLMEYEHLSFPEAVASLAQDAGLLVPHDASVAERPKPPAALGEALEQAAAFYRQALKATPRAIDYLRRRGLSGQIAARYGLGYAPPDGGLRTVFADYGADALALAGLVIDDERGRRDRFRDRIMFPIRNGRGQLIGFGGRVLGDGEPKYLNSPETPLFHKGTEIYGLFEAREAIKSANRVIVVEGYMDTVALAQHGVGFAVATLGTSTSPLQARTLLRHADRVVYAFDGDAAGRKAAWRALENTLETLQDGKQAEFLFLPEGEDPDSFVRERGREAFLRLLDNETVPLSAFLLRELTRGMALDNPEARARFLKSAKPLVDRVAAPLLRGLLIREIAALARIDADDLRHFGFAAAPRARSQATARSRRPPPSRLKSLARALLMRPQRAAEVLPEWIDPADADAPAALGLLGWLRDTGLDARLPTLLEAARGSPFESIIDSLAAEIIDLDEDWDWDAEFDGALAQLRADWKKRRLQVLSARPLDSLSPDERAELCNLARS